MSNKVVFFTAQNPAPRKPTCSGCAERPIRQYLPDPVTGEDVLSIVGSDNIYEKTQLARPDDLYTLLKKTGVEPDDFEELARSKEYASSLIDDFCSAPHDLIEAHNVIHRAQRSFDQLPLDVKQEFDNSSANMLKSLLDNTFETRMSKFIPKKNEPEVNTDETK